MRGLFSLIVCYYLVPPVLSSSTGVASSSSTGSSATSSSGSSSSSSSSSSTGVVAPLPSPILTTVRLSSTGVRLILTFDIITNVAGTSITSTGWPRSISSCSYLFTSITSFGEGSQCQWNDANTIEIIFGSSFTISIGQSFTLFRNNIIANGYDNTATSSGSNLISIVLAPLSPIIPTITLQGPSMLGSCNDLLLDGSQSNGLIRSSLAIYQWNVSSTDATVTASVNAIQLLLNAASTSSKVTIGSSLLIANVPYSFSVSVRNYLDVIISKRVEKGLPMLRSPSDTKRKVYLNGSNSADQPDAVNVNNVDNCTPPFTFIIIAASKQPTNKQTKSMIPSEGIWSEISDGELLPDDGVMTNGVDDDDTGGKLV
jgi:hypothetical protein